jgi:hypothetical protein
VANDKRFVVKNGLQTQNVAFKSNTSNNSILAEAFADGTLSFSGANTTGILSITDDVSSPLVQIKSSNNRVPLEVDFDGTIRLGENGSIILVNGATDDGESQLIVDGIVTATIFKGTFEGLSNTIGASFRGDLIGSVFADDSTLLVDGVSGKIVLDGNTTTDLAEGDNLYHTKQRARKQAIAMLLIFGSQR